MINGSFIIVIIITIISWFIYRFIMYKKNKTINISREIILFLLITYFLILLGITIFKGFYIEFYNQFNSYAYKSEGILGIVNVFPLKETISTLINGEVPISMPLKNIFGNILIFIPMGFIIPMLFNEYDKLNKILKLGLISSLSIEIVQLFVGYNICDIDDIIFNSTGTIIGFLLYQILKKIVCKTKFINKLESISDYNTKNIFFKTFKVISVISIIIIISYTYSLYTQTAPDTLSDKELAQKLFSRNRDSEFIDSKNLGNKKFYLVKDEFGIRIQSLIKYTKTRYANTYEGHGYYNHEEEGYNIDIIHDYGNEESGFVSTISVIGKNKNAKFLEINLLGKKYKFELEKNKEFFEVYPDYVRLDDSTIDKIYNGENTNNLKISFKDEDGNEIESMERIKPKY